MKTTVGELLEKLEEYAKEYGEDTEVRLAHQPRWAFEYALDTVAAVPPECPGCEGERRVEVDENSPELRPCPTCNGSGVDADGKAVIYLAEGEQLGYLPGPAARALEWS